MSKYIKDWNPQAVKAMVAGNLVQRMGDDVGPFVVAQARARVRRDTGELAGLIDFLVTAWGDHIDGVLGVRKEGHGYLGWFHELGTSKMAAHPFLRPAVFNNGAEIVRMLGG